MNLKVRFFPTEFDVDMGNVPFFEIDKPLGPRIGQALKDVFDGENCPFFTHINLSENGFIAIFSQEVTEAIIKKVFKEWQDWVFEDNPDNVVFKIDF